MRAILLSLLFGVGAGVIDTLPMIFMKQAKSSIVSAFLQWIVLGFLIPRVTIDALPGWATGSLVALLCALPILVLIVKAEPKSILPIVVMSLGLGAALGALRGIVLG